MGIIKLFYLVIILTALALSVGCDDESCKDLPAEAQIDVVLEGIPAGDAAASEVTITVNESTTKSLPVRYPST
jgi:hypothetical protein